MSDNKRPSISKEEFFKRFEQVYQTARKKDRGNIKWAGLMLPEHTEQLREDVSNYNKVERPQLDDYDMDYIHDEIHRAIVSKSQITLKLWIDGEILYHVGKIDEVNLRKRTVKISDSSSSQRLNLDDIVGIQLEG